MLCRAPHGQTADYEIKGNKVVPILEEVETKALLEHGIEDYIEGVCRFSEAYSKNLKDNSLFPDRLLLISHYLKYVKRFMMKK
jgi:hypothetical protein